MTHTANNLHCTSACRAMLQTEFAAPDLRGRPVRVAVGGQLQNVRMVPPIYQGWAIGRLVSPTIGIIVRDAEAPERAAMLKQWQLEKFHVIESSALGVIATRIADGTQPVRVHLCGDGVSPGDEIAVRFDGFQYWFDHLIADGDGKTERGASMMSVLPNLCAVTYGMNVDDVSVH